NFQLHPAIQGRHFQLTAQCGINDTDGHIAIQVTAIAVEQVVLAHTDLYVQITGRASHRAGLTFARQTNPITSIHTRRDFHRQRFGFFFHATAMTAAARVFNNGALTTTARAGLLYSKKALLHTDLPLPMTGGAGFRLGAGFGASAVAGITSRQGWNTDFLLHPTHRFFQRQLHGVAQIGTALRATTRAATTAAAENITKDITENIAAAAAGTSAEAAAGLTVDTGMTILVVHLAFLGVAQHFIGLGGFFEFGVGVFVIRIAVRVVFHRQFAVGLFQRRRIGILTDTQNFVIISF